jgi:hypothetical protein
MAVPDPSLRCTRWRHAPASTRGCWLVAGHPFLVTAVLRPQRGWTVASDYRDGLPSDADHWDRLIAMGIVDTVFATRRQALDALALALSLEPAV